MNLLTLHKTGASPLGVQSETCGKCGESSKNGIVLCDHQNVKMQLGLPAASTTVHMLIDSLFDMVMEWVTIWKNILSLLARIGTNHFEGKRLLRSFGNGSSWLVRLEKVNGSYKMRYEKQAKSGSTRRCSHTVG